MRKNQVSINSWLGTVETTKDVTVAPILFKYFQMVCTDSAERLQAIFRFPNKSEGINTLYKHVRFTSVLAILLGDKLQ